MMCFTCCLLPRRWSARARPESRPLALGDNCPRRGVWAGRKYGPQDSVSTRDDSRLPSLQPDPLVDMDGVGVAGGPIGVYRPEDRLTPPALRRAACDITSPRIGSSSLPCPRRPHELRGSTIPSRRSFFGFAPVDGAHSELTRQRAPLFPRSTQKLAQCTVAWTLACSSTSPYSDHRCWRTAPSDSRRARAIGRSASRRRAALMSLANGVAPAAPAWRADDRQHRNEDVG
jgi:hypothetical protein